MRDGQSPSWVNSFSSRAGNGVDIPEKAPPPHGGGYLKKDFIGKYFLSEKIRINHGFGKRDRNVEKESFK